MMERRQRPRKACDLCYRKRIKCDGSRPRCSSCITYNAPDCTYKAASRKASSRNKQAEVVGANANAAAEVTQDELDESALLEVRVQTLEEQLSAVLKRLGTLEGEMLPRKQGQRLKSTHSASNQHLRYSAPESISSFTEGNSQASPFPSSIEMNASSSWDSDLPPLHEALPVVSRYLETFNSTFPLFHPVSLLQTVRNWYESPQSRDCVDYAVLNVVLALAHHTDPAELNQSRKAAVYLKNVQSVLNNVVTGEPDLRNIQVLLGMVMLFWTAEDLGPAVILVATALRLVHTLGLHTRKSSELLNLKPAESLQRNRVFWVAYILDKDISLRTRLAPIRPDSDIDLDLPPSKLPEDDPTGFVFTTDGTTGMNIFRTRVQLARVQGKVYEYVYSASAQNAQPEDRAKGITSILQLLNTWSSQIPVDFQPSRLSSQPNKHVNPEVYRHFCILHAVSLSCRALISYASAWDSFHFSGWLDQMQDYGQTVVTGQQTSPQGTSLRVPQGWEVLLEEARSFMNLFNTVEPKDFFYIRMTYCAYSTGLVFLTANGIFYPQYEVIEHDRHITDTAMNFLENVLIKQMGQKSCIWNAVKVLRSHTDALSSQKSFFHQQEQNSDFAGPSEWQALETEIVDMPTLGSWESL